MDIIDKLVEVICKRRILDTVLLISYKAVIVSMYLDN